VILHQFEQLVFGSKSRKRLKTHNGGRKVKQMQPMEFCRIWSNWFLKAFKTHTVEKIQTNATNGIMHYFE